MVAWTAAVPWVGEGPAGGPEDRTVRQPISARHRTAATRMYFTVESPRARLDHTALGGRKEDGR